MEKNNLTKLLELFPEKPWDWGEILANPNITWEYMLSKLSEKMDGEWMNISRNPNITIEFIEKHPNKPWNWNNISQNPSMTIDFIEKYYNNLNWEHMSINKFTLQNKINYYIFLQRVNICNDLVICITKFI
jgi:hypothetical protein